MVEYAHPNAIPGGVQELSSGCGVNQWTGALDLFEGDYLPWNYAEMQIDDAWSLSNGSGITIGLVDTGVDHLQSELGQNFAQGQSGGRTLHIDASDGSNGYDFCGHGTHLAGVMAAPKNTDNVLGIAWGADLASVRHHDDVVDFFSYMNTFYAINKAVGTYDADIVNMSFSVSTSWLIEYLIEYYYANGTLFFAAAGTSFCGNPFQGVIFPARIPVVNAVTAWDQTGSVPCQVHVGPEVDLLAYAGQPTTGATGWGDGDVSVTEFSSNPRLSLAASQPWYGRRTQGGLTRRLNSAFTSPRRAGA